MEKSDGRSRGELVLEIAGLQARVEELEAVGARRAAAERVLRADIEREALAALDFSERRFKDLVQSINAIVWESDARTFTFTFVSEQAESILGYPVTQWLAEPNFWASHIHPDDREAAVGYCIRRTHALANHEFEYRMIAKDDRIVWLRDLVTVEADGAAPARLRGVMFDITARKQLEAQLLQAQKMESVGRLAGGIAHDFNNLLTGILGYAELARLGLPSVSPALESLQEIRQAALRAGDLTRRLLTFARRQVAKPRVLDTDALVRDTSRLLQRVIGEDIELAIEPSPGGALIKVDAGQLEQVLVNLAVNARDAMPGGGKLTIAARLATLGSGACAQSTGLAPGSYVELTVRDTGVGMSEEATAHAFEPFFTTKEVGKGTGLGLATCYGIVTQSGGHIEIRSGEGGRGTAVVITLPRVAGAADEAPTEREGSVVRGGSETVLLVEDEPMVRALAARALRTHGYTVLEAPNGEEALRLAAAHGGGPIHLLLTDLVMPRMGGEALAAQFQVAHPATRVLFTSGHSDSGSFRVRVREHGAAFIEKPFLPAALARKVRETLDAPAVASESGRPPASG